jgi:hypothetical protein
MKLRAINMIRGHRKFVEGLAGALMEKREMSGRAV